MNFLKIKNISAFAGNERINLSGTVCSFTEKNETTICYIDANLDGAYFDPNCAVSVEIGIDGEIDGCMADYLYSSFWCRPDFGRDFTKIPERTQGLLWHFVSGKWGFILPLCSDDYTCSLVSREGQLYADLCSYYGNLNTCHAPAFVMACGDNPYKIINDCASTAAELFGIKLRNERSYPEIFEYLGWCSWDAMEIWVDEKGLLDKCQEFKDKHVPIRWAIIDDMWADIEWTEILPKFTPHSVSIKVMHASKMRDYKADPVRFPNGLDGCLASMKKYGLSIGIWHPTTGYWAGLVPGGEAERILKPYTRVMDNGRVLPDLTGYEKAYGFFSTLHHYFKQCGADFVKVDNQSFLRAQYAGVLPIGRSADNLHRAIEKSVDESFDGAIINCMGMANDNMFHRRTSSISRCSNDFSPENRSWFAKHLLQCAYNSLIQGQFNTCDWDMWWTDDGQAVKNSILRAVSGGPIYISDRADRTNPKILEPLCFSDGRILRCDGQAIPSPDDLCRDPLSSGHAFCLFNSYESNRIVAAFNIDGQDRSVTGSIVPLTYGLDCTCILYEHFSRSAVKIEAHEAYNFELNNNDDFKLFTLLPMGQGRTVIGLAGKFISPAAVIDIGNDGVRLYEGGILAWYDNDEIHFADTHGKKNYTF